jgi:glucose-1-phosphate thymidylyltransferase
MNLIIPMAGIGKRLRPHTLTVPKPLIPIAGKPIVQRLVEDIARVTPEKIERIGFVVGRFGREVEQHLLDIAAAVGAEGSLHYQDEALGTAHAVACAADLLQGKVTVAFADTLFRADFKLDTSQDGIIWVKEIDDPSQFGVVKTDAQGIITDFIEKPKTPVSNKAIIGIYYFKKGEDLRAEIQYLLDNKIMASGEYQLTVALERMKEKGTRFVPGTVDEWLDCGNKHITVASNARYLEFLPENELIHTDRIENSVIIPPVYLAPGVKIMNSVVGPGVSVGEGTEIRDSRIARCLIQKDTLLSGVNLTNSMIGSSVKVVRAASDMSLGDFTEVME